MNRVPSPHYSRLSARLAYLKATLPTPAIPASGPTQTEIDSVAFCAVMAGAACEHYIEEASLAIVEASIAKFNVTSWLGRVGKYLCVFPFVETKNPPDIGKMAAIYGGTGFDVRMSSAFQNANGDAIKKLLNIGYQRYKHQVANNHGFALKYQFRLMCAIGFDLSSLSSTLDPRPSTLDPRIEN